MGGGSDTHAEMGGGVKWGEGVTPTQRWVGCKVGGGSDTHAEMGGGVKWGEGVTPTQGWVGV